MALDKTTLWRIVAAIELVLAAAVIATDLFVPIIVILGMIAVPLLIRREELSTAGFRRTENAVRMAGRILLWVILWTLVHLNLAMPILNRLTGTTQALGGFADLRGNLGSLLGFLTLTWTVAAFGEEIVYRGYLQEETRGLLGNAGADTLLAVAVSCVLLGLAHTKQGIVGIVITALDALFFSWLKLRHNDNLWASVLAHGFSNSIGLIAFFLVAPIYGLW